ncbi:MAG: efflux RND transporter periplasmic adaptor subunit [Bacteroidota bacterium]|nr:efflux RND transporter periplasmic adaptor subunit [Bacteroidota bacterium]
MKYNKLFIISLLLLSACGEKKQSETPANQNAGENTISLTEAQMKNAGIATAKMEIREMSSILKLNGMIDVPPQNMVSISVPMGGYLKSTKLLPGMHITKGEVIAVMQDQQYIQMQQDYLTAKAKYSFLEKEYQRQKDLNQSQASSDKVYQQVESDYRSQQILITSLGEKLKLAGINVASINNEKFQSSINIYAPISGYVSSVNVNIGKYVAPTDVLFELVDPSDLHLALKVFEKDLDKLYIGQKLKAYSNSQPEKKYDGTIILIGRNLSEDHNTEVHCHFETNDKYLVPGTYMNADIEVKNTRSNVLQTDAIVRFENKEYVFKATNKNQFEMMEVTTGISENGYTQITPSQKEDFTNENFVVHGAYSLLMMMKNTEE